MDDRILLDAGSGGRASQRLISQCFMRHFSNPLLDRMDDAALLDIKGPLAMSTDSYTVTPLFFAGGSIGTLAVHGTVNDVAMLGARPRYLSCACIIEEGLELSILDRVVADMAAAAQTAGVHIVTGDTKVVPRGMCDKIFINTTGVGEIFASPVPSGHAARPGDAVLVSGALGDHGLTVMGSREGLSFLTDVASDSAPLNHMIADIITACGEVHVLRDPTRGGLATTLNEIAEQSSVCIDIEESLLPVHESVRNGCSFLGLDPLYLANEGKCICILPQDRAEAALRAMQASPYGKEAAIMRTTTLPSMLEILTRNYNFRNKSAKLYELGRVYFKRADGLADEPKVLTLGAYGDNMDFFTLKGAVEAVLKQLRIENVRFLADSENPSYHPGRCAKVYCGDRLLGTRLKIGRASCRERV